MKDFTYNGKFKLCKLCANESCNIPCETIKNGISLRESGQLEFEQLKKREAEKAERRRMKIEAKKKLGLIPENEDVEIIRKEKEKAERKQKRYLAKIELGLVDLSKKLILTKIERELFRVRETENELIDVVLMDFGSGEREYFRVYDSREDGRFDVLMHRAQMNVIKKNNHEEG